MGFAEDKAAFEAAHPIKAMAEFDNALPPDSMLPGFIVLGMKPDGEWVGSVEGSFSLGTESGRTRFFWSGDATSNFGTSHFVDGQADAQEQLDWSLKSAPDIAWAVFDVTDPDLPVTLDWRRWWWANQPAYTLSGVLSKYSARNVDFTPKR